MQLSHFLLAAVGANFASAKLILPTFPNAAHSLHTLHRHENRNDNNSSIPPFKAGQHTLKEQDDSICATQGEKQWTGSIDVTDERRLFFWFFDSRNDPENDPVVIWLQGGPGSSSMLGLFTEMGPCFLEHDADETVVNEWAWNNKASVLFIDQPAGVGFSVTKNEKALPKSDIDGAEDFQTFLRIFFSDVFPKKANLPIHVAGESYGGHYVPTYLRHIIESRKNSPEKAFQGNITSALIVSGLVDLAITDLSAYDLLCLEENGRGIINKTSCDSMRKEYPKCFTMQRRCQLNESGKDCVDAVDYCGSHMGQFYGESGRDFYDIKHKCTDDECSDPLVGNYTEYLNRPEFLAALGWPKDQPWTPFRLEINQMYFEGGSVPRVTTGDIGYFLDAAETPDFDGIRLLVMHGNDDYSCNAPGMLMAYDEMEWSQQGDYRYREWKSLPDDIDATGTWKGTKDGKLVFIRVDKSGHTVPTYQRKGSLQILEKWVFGDQWKDEDAQK